MRITIYETGTTVHIGTSQQENWVCGYGLFTQGRRKSWTEKTEKLETEHWCRKEKNLVLVVIIKMAKAAYEPAHAQSDFLYGNKYASTTCFVVWESETQIEENQ